MNPWRFLKILFVAVVLFIAGCILFYNNDPQTLGYQIRFQFKIPYIIHIESIGIPVGILLLIAFCGGMVFAAFVGGVHFFQNYRETKFRNRRIKELEDEVQYLRKKEVTAAAAINNHEWAPSIHYSAPAPQASAPSAPPPLPGI